MMVIMIIQKIDFKNLNNISLIRKQIFEGLKDIARGMIRGAMNMTNVAIAIGTAGFIVGGKVPVVVTSRADNTASR